MLPCKPYAIIKITQATTMSVITEYFSVIIFFLITSINTNWSFKEFFVFQVTKMMTPRKRRRSRD